MNVALRGKLTEEIKDNTTAIKVNSLHFDTSRPAQLKTLVLTFLTLFISPLATTMTIYQTICSECIEVLAEVCETTSLASLSLYFPPQKVWLAETLNVSEIEK